MNREKLVCSLMVLWDFIDKGLGLDSSTHELTGFHYSQALFEACAYNTYVETVSNKTDSLYSHIKGALSEMIKHTYLRKIRRISKKMNILHKDVMLAFDYTDEDFYGKVQGFDIHGWPDKGGVTGKFKFLTCSIVSDEIPQKIPLISIPIQLGHNMSYAITHCLELIKPYIGNIILVLFDRGFYAKELMYDLNELKIPYLIFVPKDDFIKAELKEMEHKEKKVIEHEYKLNRNKSVYKFESKLAFLKQVFDKKLEKNLDWVFATNVKNIQLNEIIKTYKKRWRIETGFRVQDEAEIKCKSKEMKIRYFIFMFQQLLQTQWICFYKEEVSFKRFIIEMHKTCNDLVAHAKKKK